MKAVKVLILIAFSANLTHGMNDSLFAERLIDSALVYLDSDPRLSVQISEQALETLEKECVIKTLPYLYQLLSLSYMELGEINKSIFYSKKSLDYAFVYKYDYPDNYLSIVFSHFNIVSALESTYHSIFKLERILEEHEDLNISSEFKAELHSHLATLYFEISDKKRSKMYSQRCLECASVNERTRLNCICNMALIDFKVDDTTAFEQKVRKCDSLCNQSDFKVFRECSELSLFKGRYYRIKKNYALSVEYLWSAIETFKLKRSKLIGYIDLAKTYTLGGDLCMAEYSLKIAEDMMESMELFELDKVKVQLVRARMFAKNNNLNGAFLVYEQLMLDLDKFPSSAVVDGRPVKLFIIEKYIDFIMSNRYYNQDIDINRIIELVVRESIYWDRAYLSKESKSFHALRTLNLTEKIINLSLEWINLDTLHDDLLSSLSSLISYAKVSTLVNKFVMRQGVFNIDEKVAFHYLSDLHWKINSGEIRFSDTLIYKFNNKELDSLRFELAKLINKYGDILLRTNSFDIKDMNFEYLNYYILDSIQLCIAKLGGLTWMDKVSINSKISWESRFDMLIRLNDNLLDGILLIFPDYYLHSTSFESIIIDSTTTPPTYLFHKTPIAYSLGLHLARDFSEFDTDEPRLVSFAPYFEKSNASGTRGCSDEVYSYLKCNREEAETVADIMNGDAYVGKEATKERLMNSIADYDIIHLATHACVDTINYYNSSIIMDDGPLLMSDLYETDWNGKTVVLSACNTAQGKVVSGEGVFNFARTLTELGAREVVVSLWPIDDCGTKDLVEKFYRFKKQGYGSPKALQLARIEYLDEADKLHAQPYFWAPLILISNDINVGKVKNNSPYYWWVAGGLVLICIGGIVYHRRDIRRRETARLAA